jgi:thioredoxin-related protein
MKTLFALLFFVVTTPMPWLTSLDEAKISAEQQHKMILLNFSGSDWCGPCIKMKKEVFESEAFNNIASKKLILIRADFPRAKKNQLSKEQTKHNEALAEKYNPLGKFPYTVLLDPNGKVIREWDGYIFSSQNKFISDLDKTLSK